MRTKKEGEGQLEYEAYLKSGIAHVQITTFCLWMDDYFCLSLVQSPH